MRMILLGGVIAAATTSVHGQFGIGGQVGYLTYLADYPGMTGIGINFSFGIDDQTFLRASTTFGLSPGELGYAFPVPTVANDSIAPFVPVELTSRLNTYHFWLDGQRFFGNGDYYWGGVYGLLGLGLTLARHDVTVGDYDRTRYQNVSGSTAKSTIWTLRGAVGYDLDLGAVNVFAEGGVNISTNPADGVGTAVDLPTNFYGMTGVRYWVKKGRSGVGRKSAAWKGAKKKRRKKTRGRTK